MAGQPSVDLRWLLCVLCCLVFQMMFDGLQQLFSGLFFQSGAESYTPLDAEVRRT